ncbi:MAG: NAD(P)-binding domain-containing protein, partial [Cytophagales bacterium]|nr:NAD(P)-binding domain-containing protein [Cytophagales bacterium]
MKINPTTSVLGWVGTGVMGGPMLTHLAQAGYRLLIHSRTKSKADALLNDSVRWAEPLELVRQAQVVFTMLGYPADVEQVY